MLLSGGDGVVNVKDYGARGDGRTDDTATFRNAIAAGDQVFVPKGSFRLTGRLELDANTHLFGLTRTYSSLGDGENHFRGRGNASPSFTIVTMDDSEAAPGLSHLGVRGDIQWRSGTSMLAGGLPRSISGHGGGRFYGVTNMGRQLVLQGVTHPAASHRDFRREKIRDSFIEDMRPAGARFPKRAVEHVHP